MKTSFKYVILASALWMFHPCLATTLSEIAAQVSVNSYSNFHAGLFVADGNSRGFTSGESPRVPAYEHDPARDFIHSNFQAMGYETWLDPFTFTYSGYTYTNCNNVVAVKWGTEGTNVYIVGAHYDSVDDGQSGISGICPGADDNASGTAAILEAARVLKDYVFRDTIVIIAFDAEEKGYYGSTHFVNEHLTDNVAETNATTFLTSLVKTMVNLDTIAYVESNPSNYVVIGRVRGPVVPPEAAALAQAVTNYTSLLPFQDKGYNQSDHKIFFAEGIPSFHLIEFDYNNYVPGAGINPYDHTPADSVDSPGYIDYGYATEITKALVGAVCESSGVIPPATLVQTITAGNMLMLSWQTAPDVAYSLYGASSLLQTNPWTFIQYFPPTNTTTTFSMQLDPGTNTQSMFKVESQ